MTHTSLLTGIVVALILGLSSAYAAPGGGSLNGLKAPAPIIEKVKGCHDKCLLQGTAYCHRHVKTPVGCRAVRCPASACQ
jgi:hypothetical protein